MDKDEDHYIDENGLYVFTELHHLKRGYCCQNGCRHCPYRVKEKNLRIWIDADACPNVVKEIVFRAAERTKTQVILVANAPIRLPQSGLVSIIQVSHGFDVADSRIIEEVRAGDLVVTADIPLADAVITKDALALNPRGELYTKENIKDHLATRNLMADLRDSGAISGGPKTLGLKDRQAFANQLDRVLASCDRTHYGISAKHR